MPSLARSWWSRIEPDDARERITDVNDGIVAVAGMGLGLAGAGVSAATSYMVISVSTLVGAMSVFGAKLGESFADREAQQATVDYERSRIERTPEEEIAELADWFEAKGVTPQTARASPRNYRRPTRSRHSWRSNTGYAISPRHPMPGRTVCGLDWRLSSAPSYRFSSRSWSRSTGARNGRSSRQPSP